MFKLMGKKIITIMLKYFCLTGPMSYTFFLHENTKRDTNQKRLNEPLPMSSNYMEKHKKACFRGGCRGLKKSILSCTKAIYVKNFYD